MTIVPESWPTFTVSSDGEDDADRVFDSSLAGLLSVDEEGGGAALADAATVVVELDPQLVRSFGNRPFSGHGVALETDEVVAVVGDTVEQIHAPSCVSPALGHHHTAGAIRRDHQLGGERERLVLQVEHAAVRQPRHALVQHLRLPGISCGRPAISALNRTAARSSSGSTLYLAASMSQSCFICSTLSGISRGEIMSLTPVVRRIELPDVLLERMRFRRDVPGNAMEA